MEGLSNVEDFKAAIKSGYSHFWEETLEPERSMDTMEKVFKDLREETSKGFPVNYWGLSPESEDPLIPLTELKDKMPINSVLVLKNFNWFLEENARDRQVLTQFLSDTASLFRSTNGRRIVIIMSTNSMGNALPFELHREFVSINMGLPNEDELGEKLDEIVSSASENPKFTPVKDRNAVVKSAKGMTLQSAESAFAYSCVKEKTVSPKIVNRMKASTLEESTGLKYIEPSVTFDDIIGLKSLKDRFMKTIHSPLCQGMLFIGPPGCGKTMFMSAGSNYSNLPTFELEFGNLFHKHVGETERNIKHVIKTLKAVGECMVLCDEFEKGLAGAGRSSDNDGGVTERALSQWLKFMSDRPEGIRIFGTCNDIRAIPPEYLRAERWDTAPWYIGLPTYDTQMQILKYYKKKFQYKGKDTLGREDLQGWSGAEIKAVVRNAVMADEKLTQSKDVIIPISKTMKESIDYLQHWAIVEGRALNAEEDELKYKDGSKRSVEM